MSPRRSPMMVHSTLNSSWSAKRPPRSKSRAVGPSSGRPGASSPVVEASRRQHSASRRCITNVIPHGAEDSARRGAWHRIITVQAWNEAVDCTRVSLPLARPSLIVAVGDIALQALRGHGGVLKWRGSLLVYEPLGSPAASPQFTPLPSSVILHWNDDVLRTGKRSRKNSATPAPKRGREAKHHIAPSFHKSSPFDVPFALSKADTVMSSATTINCRHQTPRKMQTVTPHPSSKSPRPRRCPAAPSSAASLASPSPDESITIPTMPALLEAVRRNDGTGLARDRSHLRKLVSKVLQNGFFDASTWRAIGASKMLGRGIRLRNYKHDTFAKHHVPTRARSTASPHQQHLRAPSLTGRTMASSLATSAACHLILRSGGSSNGTGCDGDTLPRRPARRGDDARTAPVLQRPLPKCFAPIPT